MKTLKLIQSDSYLRPYASAIEGRYNYAIAQEKKLTGGQKLSDWANGYMFFGSPVMHVAWCKIRKPNYSLHKCGSLWR